MSVRRSVLVASLALTLSAGSAAVVGGAVAAPADDAPAAKVATTGRFITTTSKGVVLVDEDGKKQKTLIKAKKAKVVDVFATTGVFMWNSAKGKQKTTWHVTNLYGADLGEVRLPKNSSQPATDFGGYEIYWVREGSTTTNAAIMKLEINDPQAEPKVLRELGPGTATDLSVSPDFQWVAVALDGLTGRTLQLVSADGATVRTVPAPAGTSIYSDHAVFSPDSGRVAFTAGAALAPVGTVYVAPVAGDYAPLSLGTTIPRIFDWSPDGATLLGGSPGVGNLVGINATTGATTATYPIDHTASSDVFWSGLAAGVFPKDRVKPKLKVDLPKADTVRSWKTVSGTATDKGGSELRYVIFRAFQKRGSAWWGLVGNGKRPRWKKFPNRIEAKLFAKERRAKITDDEWQLGVPGLVAGQLVIVAKAADGAGNSTARTVSVGVR